MHPDPEEEGLQGQGLMPCGTAINGISHVRKGDQVVKSPPGSGRARIQARPSGPSEPHTGSRGHLATQGARGPANKRTQITT